MYLGDLIKNNKGQYAHSPLIRGKLREIEKGFFKLIHLAPFVYDVEKAIKAHKISSTTAIYALSSIHLDIYLSPRQATEEVEQFYLHMIKTLFNKHFSETITWDKNIGSTIRYTAKSPENHLTVTVYLDDPTDCEIIQVEEQKWIPGYTTTEISYEINCPPE